MSKDNYYNYVMNEKHKRNKKRNKRFANRQFKLAHSFFKPLGYTYEIVDYGRERVPHRYQIHLVLPIWIVDNYKKGNKYSPLYLIERQWRYKIKGLKERTRFYKDLDVLFYDTISPGIKYVEELEHVN